MVQERDFQVDPSFDENAPIGAEQSTHPDLAEAGGEEAPQQTQAESPWDWKPHFTREIEYNAAGKTIKEPLEMVLKRASQGYDYAQKVGEWNNKERGFTEKLTAAEQRLKDLEYLREVDEFARKNPEWKKHIDQSYQQRDAFQQGFDPNDKYVQYANQRFDKVNETLQNLSSKLSQFDEFVSTQRISKEDQELDAEVQSIRTQYANLDWDARDEFGKTLEQQVLEHAAKLNLGSAKGAFRIAFKDFNHDRLLKMAEEKAKEKVADQAHRLKQQGFIGKSSTPQTSFVKPKSIREKSYEDIASEIREEFGIN